MNCKVDVLGEVHKNEYYKGISLQILIYAHLCMFTNKNAAVLFLNLIKIHK